MEEWEEKKNKNKRKRTNGRIRRRGVVREEKNKKQ